MSLCHQVYIKTLHSHRLEVVYTDKFFDYFSRFSPGEIRRSRALKIKISPFLKQEKIIFNAFLYLSLSYSVFGVEGFLINFKINVECFPINIITLLSFWSEGFL